jgi:hypothetical protein
MGGNHAILEVKPVLVAQRGLEKDLTTLALFRRNVGYARAIYLIYGEGLGNALVDGIVAGAAKLVIDVPVELWLHTEPRVAAFQALTISP